MSDIQENLASIHARIDAAARGAGRSGNGITLLAVSKTQRGAMVEAALAAGQRDFGENRVQEAQKKFLSLKPRYPDLKLHMIGPLQTNKVADAVALFDSIHSVDRPKLAKLLGEEMRRQNRRPACFIEVNIGQEPQKAGIAPGDVDSFLVLCKESYCLPIAGLMCIPPEGADPLPYFRQLAEIARRGRVSCLSMGMSGDFERAIAAGATHVRVGTAIFGSRPKPDPA